MRKPLPPEVFSRALRSACKVAGSRVQLTNAVLRVAAGLRYDEAVQFFKQAVATGVLERRGTGPQTHYVLAEKPKR